MGVQKSSWWWYVLLGLIVFIVIILIIDKKNRVGDTVSDRQNRVIEALRSEYSNSKQVPSEEQAKVMTEIRKDTGTPKATSEEQNQILNQIRGGVN